MVLAKVLDGIQKVTKLRVEFLLVLSVLMAFVNGVLIICFVFEEL